MLLSLVFLTSLSTTPYLFYRLHSIQRSMKELTEESVSLHNKIVLGEFPDDRLQIKESSAFLRKLLNQTKPVKVSHEQILNIKKNIEIVKFRVQLLQEKKSHKLAELKKHKAVRDRIIETNQEKGNF